MKFMRSFHRQVSNGSNGSNGPFNHSNHQVSPFKLRKRFKNSIKAKYEKLFSPHQGEIEIISYWNPYDATVKDIDPGTVCSIDEKYVFSESGTKTVTDYKESSITGFGVDVSLTYSDTSDSSTNCSRYCLNDFSNNRAEDNGDCVATYHGGLPPSSADYSDTSNASGCCSVYSVHEPSMLVGAFESTIDADYTFDVSNDASVKYQKSFTIETSLIYGNYSNSGDAYLDPGNGFGTSNVSSCCSVSSVHEPSIFAESIESTLDEAIYTCDVFNDTFVKDHDSFTIETSSIYGSHKNEEDYSFDSKSILHHSHAIVYGQTVFHDGVFQSVKDLSMNFLGKDDLTDNSFDPHSFISDRPDKVDDEYAANIRIGQVTPSYTPVENHGSFTVGTGFVYGSHANEKDDFFHSRRITSASTIRYKITDTPSAISSLREGALIHDCHNENSVLPASASNVDNYIPLAASDSFGDSIIPFQVIPTCMHKTHECYVDIEPHQYALRDDEYHKDLSQVLCDMSSDAVTIDFNDQSNIPSVDSSRLVSMERHIIPKACYDTVTDGTLNESDELVDFDVLNNETTIDNVPTFEDDYIGSSSAEPKSSTFDTCEFSSIESPPTGVPRNDIEIAQILSHIQSLDEMLLSLMSQLNKGLEHSERISVLEMINVYESSLSDLQAELHGFK